jgi:hypothetical protein
VLIFAPIPPARGDLLRHGPTALRRVHGDGAVHRDDHPAVGPVLFVGVRVANRRIEDVIRHLVPYFIALVILLAFVAYTPSLSTWLPGLLGL